MSALLTPIATPLICDVRVRFFRAPLPDPHLSWHALTDLHRAMGLSWAVRRDLMERIRSFPHEKGEFATVETVDGSVFIGSHPMALGVISAVVEAHGAPPDFGAAYSLGAIEAMKAMTAGMSAHAALEFTMVAARNTLGVLA